MKIAVSTKNEYPFYPDIENNLELPVKDRFAIVCRKINQAMTSGSWSNYTEDGELIIDIKSKLRQHIVRIDNAPVLNIDDGADTREMTIDDLLGSDFPELYDIATELMKFAGKIQNEGELEVKKS